MKGLHDQDIRAVIKDSQDQNLGLINAIYNKDDKSSPSVTVITVTFNAVNYLEETIKSVLSQDYSNLEYIIIDGGSSDGTLDVIKKYESSIDYWLSEKDCGVYDAMNKGIKLASGAWINLMNAGDIFNGPEILTYAMVNRNDADIIFSDTVFLNKGISEVDAEKKCFIHQSLIYKKDLHIKYGFYLSFKNVTISDYLFFYKILEIKNVVKIDLPISIYRSDGLSSKPSHYYQKLGVDLMFQPDSAHIILCKIAYKKILEMFYYPLIKLINNG